MSRLAFHRARLSALDARDLAPLVLIAALAFFGVALLAAALMMKGGG